MRNALGVGLAGPGGVARAFGVQTLEVRSFCAELAPGLAGFQSTAAIGFDGGPEGLGGVGAAVGQVLKDRGVEGRGSRPRCALQPARALELEVAIDQRGRRAGLLDVEHVDPVVAHRFQGLGAPVQQL